MNFALPTLIASVIYVLSHKSAPQTSASTVDAQAIENKTTRKGIVTSARPVNICRCYILDSLIFSFVSKGK